MNTLHAHVSTSASDCDGRIDRTRIEWMTDEEKADTFADLTFKNRILGSYVSVVPGIGVTVAVTMDGFIMAESTDEGYSNAEVRWCEDETCDNGSTYRDHRAESMGY